MLYLGQITPSGLQQSYKFGQMVKSYYQQYLSTVYQPQRVYARSVDVDRSIVSLETFLAGMYPPANQYQTWSQNLQTWYPVPVHTKTSNDRFQVFILLNIKISISCKKIISNFIYL